MLDDEKRLDPSRLKAAVFDLDGVITRTAHLHAKAWKRMFDEYFAGRPGGKRRSAPFDLERDYPEHLDGKPRFEGVRDMLASRGIELDYGSTDDPPGRETVCGLGNRKNEIFNEMLDEQGAEVFEDGVSLIESLRAAGVGIGLVTSSRNGRPILETTKLTGLFEVIIDGNDARELDLAGKPAPDLFVAAAKRLGASPAEAAVFEDAISGVQAGRAGGFGLVVGVDRVGGNHPGHLSKNGADIVLSDLSTLEPKK